MLRGDKPDLRTGLRFGDRLHNPIQRPASLTTAFTVPGESREAACRLGEPTSAGVSDQPDAQQFG
jgi:hypothetical protein